MLGVQCPRCGRPAPIRLAEPGVILCPACGHLAETAAPARSTIEAVARNDGPKYLRDEKLLMDFVDTAAIGLHWVASDGTILWANPADYEPLGYTADEYIGHNITEFHADSAAIGDILQRLTSGERLQEYEAPLRCKDGSVRHVAITSSVLFDEDRFVHTRCFTRDVTDRKRAERALEEKVAELTVEVERRERVENELRKANAIKDDFLSIASHELRTPLATLRLGMQSFLRNGELIRDERQRFRLLKMDRQVDRLVRLVNALLDVSRIGKGEVKLDRETFDLAELAREVTAHFDDEARAAGTTLELRASNSLIGEWDRLRIDQVISNLLGNAIKYGAGAPVRARGRASAGRCAHRRSRSRDRDRPRESRAGLSALRTRGINAQLQRVRRRFMDRRPVRARARWQHHRGERGRSGINFRGPPSVARSARCISSCSSSMTIVISETRELATLSCSDRGLDLGLRETLSGARVLGARRIDEATLFVGLREIVHRNGLRAERLVAHVEGE